MDLKKLNKEERQKWAAGLMDQMADAALADNNPVHLYTDGAAAYANLLADTLGSINSIEAPLVIAGLGVLRRIVSDSFPDAKTICNEYLHEILENVSAQATTDDGGVRTVYDGGQQPSALPTIGVEPLFGADGDDRKEFWRLVAEGAAHGAPSASLATEALKKLGYREEDGRWTKS